MGIVDTLRFIARHPLNRGSPARALLRYAKWQVGSRLVPGAVIVEWVNGARLLVRPGETGLTGNIYTGLHELDDMAFVLHVLRRDDLFVDVGANAGAYTILACAAAGARGYAFEPVPATYARLVENVRLNRLENRVTCIEKAVGEAPGFAEITCDLDALNHVVPAGSRGERVARAEVCCLDGVLRDETPAVVKIDVEGFELPVLCGAAETLAKPSLLAVLVELNGSDRRYGFEASDITELLTDRGFRPRAYEPASRTLVEIGTDGRGPGNALFVRNEAHVRDRLRDAREPTLRGEPLFARHDGRREASRRSNATLRH